MQEPSFLQEVSFSPPLCDVIFFFFWTRNMALRRRCWIITCLLYLSHMRAESLVSKVLQELMVQPTKISYTERTLSSYLYISLIAHGYDYGMTCFQTISSRNTSVPLSISPQVQSCAWSRHSNRTPFDSFCAVASAVFFLASMPSKNKFRLYKKRILREGQQQAMAISSLSRSNTFLVMEVQVAIPSLRDVLFPANRRSGIMTKGNGKAGGGCWV